MSIEALSVESSQSSIVESNGLLVTVTRRLPGNVLSGQYTSENPTLMNSLYATLLSLEATTTYYSHGAGEPAFLIYGFNRGARLELRSDDVRTISLQVESLN